MDLHTIDSNRRPSFSLEEKGAGHHTIDYINGTEERVSQIRVISEGSQNEEHMQVSSLVQVLKDTFLPAGYPDSVSPDYLRYQIFDSLQACCSSMAALLSSRALLEGFGVGNASASATHAMVLTVLQDVFSRITTILAAYYFGTSIWPEAKMYRFLADVFNDMAFILDALSPVLVSLNTSPYLPAGAGAKIRVAALCVSGALKALCGVAAGGSKTALTVHFAGGTSGAGVIGDLNAKEASQETVVGLTGMLCGMLIVPYLTTPSSTYSALFILAGLHLALNYSGIRGVNMGTLNRQRLAIAWMFYNKSDSNNAESQAKDTLLSPSYIARHERIFQLGQTLRDALTGAKVGECHIGSPLSSFLPHSSVSSRSLFTSGPAPPPAHITPEIQRLIDIFADEKYILWYDQGWLVGKLRGSMKLHITVKQGSSKHDMLKAYVNSVEAAKLWYLDRGLREYSDPISVMQTAHQRVVALFPDFMASLHKEGWIVDEGIMASRSPIILSVSTVGHTLTIDGDVNNRKRL